MPSTAHRAVHKPPDFWFGTRKLVKAPGAGAEFAERHSRATVEGAHLYNLAADISEQNNLAAKEPDKVKQLAAAWEKWNATVQEPRSVPGRAARRR